MARQYPKRELRKLTLSTQVPCAAGCGRPTGIHEEVLTDDQGNYYHQGCGSKSAPVVHNLTLDDDLKVDSK